MNNILKITSVSETKTSKGENPRRYKTVYFQKENVAGVFSNAKERVRNLWEEGPNGSKGDPLFAHAKPGIKVYGSIERIDVKPYYIPSKYGKDTDPETGMSANKVTTFTSVVFEDENIRTLARANNLTPADEIMEADRVTASAQAEFEPAIEG